MDPYHRIGSLCKRWDTLPGTERTEIADSPRQLAVFERPLARLGERDMWPAAEP